MAKPDARPLPRLPLFDRLMLGDDAPPAGRETALRLLRESVRRDLQILLNTRPRCRSHDPALDELATSLVAFGMPDLQARSVATPAQRETLRADIEALIRRYETRFLSVSVELIANPEPTDPSLRLRIRALLAAEADAQPVVYDTMVEPVTRSLVVAAAERGD